MLHDLARFNMKRFFLLGWPVCHCLPVDEPHAAKGSVRACGALSIYLPLLAKCLLLIGRTRHP